MAEQAEKELLSLTNDYVFRRIFAEKNKPALADFLAAVLDMTVEELGEITVDDPNIYREHKGGKGGVLDIRAHTKSGEIYHVEVQLNPDDYFANRITYYNSRIYSGQLESGDEYSVLHRTISIVITNKNFLKENNDYNNKFQWYNSANGCLLTDAQEINTLELDKLPVADDCTKLWKWLKLLKTRRGDEMEEIAKDNSAMKDVVVTLRKMSADESERMHAEWREKEERDRASRHASGLRQGLREGREKGLEEGREKGLEEGRVEGAAQALQETARKMKEYGDPVDKISDITGLTTEEISRL